MGDGDVNIPEKITFWTILYVLFTHPQDLKYGMIGITGIIVVLMVGILLYTGVIVPADVADWIDHTVVAIKGLIGRV